MIIGNKKKIGKIKKKQLSKKREPFIIRLLAKKFLLSVIGLIMMITISAWLLTGSDLFIIKRYIIEGNINLTKEEVVSMTGITNRNLFTLDKKSAASKLMDSSWIKAAYIRKVYPDTLMLRIEEITPIALYQTKGTTYVIDENGERIDIVGEVRKDLPLIKLSTNNKEVYKEAVILSGSLLKSGILAWTPVEINGSQEEDLSVTLSGVRVVIGSGDYETKLKKYMVLKDEIARRNYPIEYIDVRFQKRLIVKTQKTV